MKNMHVYDVYLDDGDDTIKATIPAESAKAAEQYVSGNGEVIKIRLNPYIQDIDINCLTETLTKSGWGRTEIDIITRALWQVGLARDRL